MIEMDITGLNRYLAERNEKIRIANGQKTTIQFILDREKYEKIALKCLEKGKKVTFTKICKKYGLFSLLKKAKSNNTKMSQDKQKSNTNEISM